MIFFTHKLDKIIDQNSSLLCVGLDPVLEKIPEAIRSGENPLFTFNKAIVDLTHDLVCAYKPNTAFYEALGLKGITQLKMTCDYISSAYPEIPVILDAKRGDIGNTNLGYAKYAFDFLNADAITVIPYMGIESLEAFFTYKEKGVIVGCHSSNPGAKEFQELSVNGEPLYHVVAKRLIELQGANANTMLFMGATYPEELTAIRKIIGDMTMLVPGVGAQGGNVKSFVTSGKNTKGRGLIINSSRGIIFASSEEDFAEKAREEAIKLRDEINAYR